MATAVHKKAKRPGATLQLHIELRGSKPKIWRRVLVPETITLAKLHAVIQAAFGWSAAGTCMSSTSVTSASALLTPNTTNRALCAASARPGWPTHWARPGR